MLQTVFSIVATSVLSLLMLMLYVRRTLPNLLEDVAVSAGEQITESLNEVIASPNVKKAMSILGTKSGEVRADKALKTKVAEKVMGSNVLVSKVCDYLGISAMEGLSLMSDPTFGPIIQGFIARGTQGIGKALTNPGSSQNRANGGVGYS